MCASAGACYSSRGVFGSSRCGPPPPLPPLAAIPEFLDTRRRTRAAQTAPGPPDTGARLEPRGRRRRRRSLAAVHCRIVMPGRNEAIIRGDLARQLSLSPRSPAGAAGATRVPELQRRPSESTQTRRSRRTRKTHYRLIGTPRRCFVSPDFIGPLGLNKRAIRLRCRAGAAGAAAAAATARLPREGPISFELRWAPLGPVGRRDGLGNCPGVDARGARGWLRMGHYFSLPGDLRRDLRRSVPRWRPWISGNGSRASRGRSGEVSRKWRCLVIAIWLMNESHTRLPPRTSPKSLKSTT